jgi:NAD(P)-dependent dehydrogenase (short-subunit alcohol dehydrogenase family)
LGKIDLLVNMGAANQSKHGKLRDTTEHDIKDMVDTNVLGTLHVAREAALLLEPGSQVVLCGDAGTTRQFDSIFVRLLLTLSPASASRRATRRWRTPRAGCSS